MKYDHYDIRFRENKTYIWYVSSKGYVYKILKKEGYIEYYPVKFEFHKAIVNEEGLIYGMKFNQKAAAEFGILARGPVLIIPDAFLDLE